MKILSLQMPNTESEANCVFVFKERKTSGSMFSAILAEEPEYFPMFFLSNQKLARVL